MPPRAVEFTWGWHDETDTRGPESRVRIDLAPDGAGTAFVLTHREPRRRREPRQP